MFKNNQSSFILTANLALLLITTPQILLAQQSKATLAKSAIVATNIGLQKIDSHNIEIPANSQQEPKLLVHQKRTIDILSTDDKKTLERLEKLGITAEILAQTFTTSNVELTKKIQKANLSDYYFIDFFAHGYVDFSQDDIYKREIKQTDQARFWIAIIPKFAQFNNIIMQREWFSEGVGTHGQIRFVLDTPILLWPRLIENKVNLTNEKIKKLQKEQTAAYAKKNGWRAQFAKTEINQPRIIPGDLVYSLMAVRYEGGPKVWNAHTGITGAFANTYGMSSTSHMAVYQSGSYIDQIELKNAKIAKDKIDDSFFSELVNLNQYNQAREVFNSALKKAQRSQEKQVYHLIFNNCIGATYEILAPTYFKSKKKVDKYTSNPYTFIETLFEAKVTMYSEINENQSVNEEFGSPIKQKAMTEDVKNNLDILQSDVFDSTIRKILYVLLPLNYNDLLLLQSGQVDGTSDMQIRLLKSWQNYQRVFGDKTELSESEVQFASEIKSFPQDLPKLINHPYLKALDQSFQESTNE